MGAEKFLRLSHQKKNKRSSHARLGKDIDRCIAVKVYMRCFIISYVCVAKLDFFKMQDYRFFVKISDSAQDFKRLICVGFQFVSSHLLKPEAGGRDLLMGRTFPS